MNLWNIYAKIYKVLRSNPVTKTILHTEHQSLLKLLVFRIPSITSGQALDLGTGRGDFLKCNPTDIGNIYAIDNSPRMVALTRKTHDYVDVVLGDALDTPFDNECMDLILCVGLSEYIADIDVLLNEIFSVLKSDGFAIMDFPWFSRHLLR